jgi:ribose/xylose/arabinose/galactoside ABC-type transport system permease subunit
VLLALGLSTAPIWVCVAGALLCGAVFGACNGFLIVHMELPPFIVTLATVLIGRGLGLYLSATKIVFASSPVARLGRARLDGLPAPLLIAAATVLLAGLLLWVTPFGPYLRSIGADREGAKRVGVPVEAVTFASYVACGALAGLGGFISLSQTSSASGAFGENSEFLAIAAAVLGGTSLFGGRGHLWAPLIGAVLIMTVQNGLVMINANPYAYPVVTGGAIFLAALLDSIRLRTAARIERRRFAAE